MKANNLNCKIVFLIFESLTFQTAHDVHTNRVLLGLLHKINLQNTSLIFLET